MDLKEEIQKRKTFAIISHPDAGKTTLTEKFLLFGGAIHIAGAVKSKKTDRYASSDFMEIERQRGISVATSVMGFEYEGTKINLLDTPGHQDFCEDTYRTLTAVDSTVMVIDAVRGVQEQTYKLLDVCRMRNTPVITFINKLDRDGKTSIELLDEIEEKLKITVVPLSWPIGMGKRFKGVYNIYEKRLLLFKPHQKQDENSIEIKDLSDPKLDELLQEDAAKLREELDLIMGVYPKFSQEDYLAGKVTPVFFGSALNNFGVKELLDCFIKIAPAPLPRETDKRQVEPSEAKFSGFVFKIHANIDPKHRDRIAFLRVCSGKFERNKWYHHVQSNKDFRSANPTAFMASERMIIDDAYPGDIIGLHDTGTFKIGDTLTEGEKLVFKGIPNFSPEVFRLVVNQDPMKTKQLNLGLQHLCEEGVAQLFMSDKFMKKVLGTVGPLQFEVIQYRLLKEYGANCRFDQMNFIKALWLKSENKEKLASFMKSRANQILFDKNNQPVYLAETKWSLDREIKENPEIQFMMTSE
ncbi:MAG: peptide chain release factor 3 [Candidatus Margulisiibacteriota bacterium]|jgi:peptide chain release factor 3